MTIGVVETAVALVDQAGSWVGGCPFLGQGSRQGGGEGAGQDAAIRVIQNVAGFSAVRVCEQEGGAGGTGVVTG